METGPTQPGDSAASSADAPATEEEMRYLWKRRHEAEYRVRLSHLYHRKRERFFALLDRISTAAAIVAGSAAFSELLPTAGAKAWAGAAVAIVTLPGLVFAWGESARRHAGLAARFKNVEADIVAKGERDFTEQDTTRWDQQIRVIEAEEPPTLSTLVHHCQIELDRAMGSKPTPLPWRKRVLMHLFDMSVAP